MCKAQVPSTVFAATGAAPRPPTGDVIIDAIVARRVNCSLFIWDKAGASGIRGA